MEKRGVQALVSRMEAGASGGEAAALPVIPGPPKRFDPSILTH